MSGSELAEKLNVSQQQISRYERGITKLNIEKLIELAIYLDLDFSILKYEFIKEKEKEKEKEKISFINDTGSLF
ncbi:helix-turn-helix domain-containing protein [Providencia burhodogranariea]|uniref:Transcriptional regulator n=1 Tax=Providencia burhodogranariea DSM 19968 TaxID=1141662 RepID=K8WI50_9GAMM|nr:transcriptional regulator [Providencia burhodogranariea DSM 19968]